nr:unnamed protein product [Callosobruchus analis]
MYNQLDSFLEQEIKYRCPDARYLDNEGLLLAVRSNRSWLEYAKADPVLSKRINSALLKKREDFLEMKNQVIVQRPLPVPGTFHWNNQKLVFKKSEDFLRHEELYEKMQTRKDKSKEAGGKVKSIKRNVRNKPYRLVGHQCSRLYLKMFRILPLLAASYLPALPTEIWCLILRYLDDEGLLLAVRSNRSWLEYAKADPILNKRINSVLLKKREDFLKMKNQVVVQRPLPVPGTFHRNNQKVVIRKSDDFLRHKELYEEMQTQKNKSKESGGKVKSVKRHVRNKPYRLYLDDEGLLLAVRSNRSWLEYAKADPVPVQTDKPCFVEKERGFLEDEEPSD